MGAHILIVEDNPANLDLMTYLLTAFGYTVSTARDGLQGIEAIRREHPKLIICDIQLPEMDGYEVARWLKSDPKLKGIPLVAVTALAMVGDRKRVLEAGFDGYLAKPIDPETFVQQIEVYLPLTRHFVSPFKVEASKSSPRNSNKGCTILVVDNQSINLDLALSILGPNGYKVITADGVKEGLARARETVCDLILSDVCMSDGSGYDFIQVVQSDPRLRDIPFVFITSTMLDGKDRAKGLALGATKFLVRPIEPEVFLAEIQACLLRAERS